MSTQKKCASCKTKCSHQHYVNAKGKVLKTCARCRQYQKQYRLKKKKPVAKTYTIKMIMNQRQICTAIEQKQYKLRHVEIKSSSTILFANSIDQMPSKKLLTFVKKWATDTKIKQIKKVKPYQIQRGKWLIRYDNKFHSAIEDEFKNIENATALSSFRSLMLHEIEKKGFKLKDAKALMDNDKVQKILYSLSTNHSTIRRNCTRINNAIKATLSKTELKKLDKKKHLVFLKWDDAVELNRVQAEKAEKSNLNVITMPSIKIVQFADQLKKSSDWRHKMILIAMSIGSRLIEILDKRVSQYRVYPKREGFIEMIGVAKGKEEDLEIDKKTKPLKPVLFDIEPKDMVQMIKDVRSKLTSADKKKTREKLSNTYGKGLNKELRRLTENMFEFPKNRPIHFHDLRRIYANYAYDVIGRLGSSSYLGFIKQVLGHATSGSVKNYSSLKIEHLTSEEDKKAIEKVLRKADELEVVDEKQQVEIKALQNREHADDIDQGDDEEKDPLIDLRTVEYMNTRSRSKDAEAKRQAKIKKLVAKLKERGFIPQDGKPKNSLLKSFGFGVRSIQLWRNNKKYS